MRATHVAQLLRRRGAVAWAGGIATLLAFWWVIGAFDTSTTWTVSNEPVSDLLWAQAQIERPFTKWFGVWSVIGAPHPGPVYIWVLALGIKLAAVLHLAPAVGAYLLYTAAAAGLIAVGAHLARHAFESVSSGWVYALCAVASMSSTRGLQLQSYGMSVGQGSALTLSAALLAVLAVCTRWEKGPLWCVITGGLLVQLRTEFVPIGLGALVLGLYLTRRRSLRLRAALGWAGVLLAPLAIRFIQEGPTMLTRYISGARDAYELETGSRGSLLDTVPLWRLNSNLSVFLLIAAVIGLAVYGISLPHWRRRGIVALVLWAGVLMYLLQSMDLGAAHGTMLLTVHAAALAALLRRARLASVSMQVFAAVAMLCMTVAAHAGLPVVEVGMNTSPRLHEIAQRIDTLANGRDVELHYHGGPVTPELQGSVLNDLAPVLFELRSRGVDACIVGVDTLYDGGQLIPNRYICESRSERYAAGTYPSGVALDPTLPPIGADLGALWVEVRGT